MYEDAEQVGNMVKVGPKRRYLRIPDGWERVRAGKLIREGDKVANILTAAWMMVERGDVGLDADCYDVIIRRTEGWRSSSK
jgi:hypothetical protein